VILMRLMKNLIPITLMILAVGCATLPTGPSVRVFPAPGKPFDLFLAEDSYCRQFAERQIGILPQEVANQSTATGAIIGTAGGTGIGAALGSVSGDAGAGAVIGGVSGLAIGAASGADAGRMEGREAQRRYDTAYLQCMYSHGNQVPGVIRVYRRRVAIPPPVPQYNYAPPAAVAPYYPPPGTPPPPPGQ
jgi:hypothetical protein